MKSILLSIKPQWVAKILNGKQTILVMKKAPKKGVGCWWYLYCSKSGDLMKEYDTLKFTGNLQGKMLRANYRETTEFQKR